MVELVVQVTAGTLDLVSSMQVSEQVSEQAG